MRRSAAPSQVLGNVAKKPRFIPPGKSITVCLKNETKEMDQEIKLKEIDEKEGSTSLLSEIYGQNQNANFTQSVESTGKVKTTKVCFSVKKCSKVEMKTLNTPKADALYLPTLGAAKEEAAQEEPDCLAKYFSVVWCKASKKKHKKWEGDAVLITKGKSVILKDMEGKDIGRDSLVMPKPNASHQWMFNKAGLPMVDVVVDPYIANNLRPHQKEGIIFLYECVMGMRVSGRFGAILADEMGLGKTLQCIALVWTLLRQGVYGCKPVLKRALIVTPGSLVKNWKKEFQKWLGSERIKVFTVDQDHKVEEFIGSPLYSVMIISYEMLLRSLDQIQAIEFNLLICDEGHRLKNSSIKTTTALTSLSCDRRIILTGTPIQNDLQEFYALIEFVNPGILGSLSTYRKIYEEPIVRSREPSATKEEKELGEKRAAELTRLTGLFILRRTQEIINKFLPPKKESIIFCRPTALQLELYQKLLSSRVIRSCLQGRLENSPHLICIGALKKLCNHPCLLFKAIKEKSCDPVSDERDESSLYEGLIDVFPQDYTSDTFSETDSGKLQVLVKLLAAIHELNSSERVVLVSNYTQTLNILQETCKRYGYSYTRLDGHTPVSQRQQIVDTFNSKFSPAFIFLLSSKAGGVGLNLVGASHLILYDIDWNPATDIQAMARVWRDGQKHTVYIYRLLTTGSIEEKIYQRQISKQDLSGAVVDLSKTSEHIHFSIEELRNLFTLHEDSTCVTHDLLECDCMGKKDHQNPSSEKPSVSRSCQLGQNHGKPHSKKPLSMSQLMQWKHFSGQHQTLTDPFLERIKENVSFIFQNVTSPTSTS
ncbi:DNA repair and recombination protein RAD54B isoform X3 [Aquila chrysaetos chrysaetos]|uniref:DNA repair and recombination protein RAD54B isoform X3 n=1 Tax=Aquila chrysaetos chrysaetos TaxID=223781 RepID=UPI00117725B3|nr:DNA repair and recombination protein RAD54B isoform X3 [Aquila chrysaetos chrysaetos]